MRLWVDEFLEEAASTSAFGHVGEGELLDIIISKGCLVVHGCNPEFERHFLTVFQIFRGDHGDAEIFGGVGREVDDQEIAAELTRCGPNGAVPAVGLIEANNDIERDVVLIANAILKVLFLAGREARLLCLVRDFQSLRNDFFADDDLHGEVEVSSVVDFHAFLDDAGVDRVLTGLNLASKGDFEFHVDVLVGRQVNRHKVGVAAVGNGVVPCSVLWVVVGILLNIPRVDNLPRR